MAKNNIITLGMRIVKVMLIIGIILMSVYVKSPDEILSSTPTVITAETLNEILKRAATISSIKLDIVTTIPGMPPAVQKVWMKKNKMRIEMMEEKEWRKRDRMGEGIMMEKQTIVLLMDTDAKTMYEYIPGEKVATKIVYPKDADFGVESLIKVEDIEKHKPVIVGTETINGKTCIVVEYTEEGAKGRSWIWKDKGIPIRMEMEMPFMGKMTMEYKNIEFVDIPDSMFELPAGVRIRKEKAAGFGCIPRKDPCPWCR